MATKLTLERLLDRYGPVVKQAFLEAVEDIKSNAEIGRIARALERGDIDAAIRAVHLDPAAFRGLERAIADAFEGGGSNAVTGMPARLVDPAGERVVIRFDVRNVRAERWLRDHSSVLVTDIVADQRNAIRNTLEAGLRAGRNPRSTALDIVGRVETGANRRVGGIIGLTAQQAGFVANARAELLSGDPAQMRHYLTRGRRFRTGDRTVLKAIREGKALDPATVDRLIGRYSDSLLQLRGETLSRTETMAALGEAKYQAYVQAIDDGAMDADLLTKVWKSAPPTEDARVQHQAMRGQEVKFMAAFVAPDGTHLRFPGDPQAPIRHTANCRCDWDVRYDFFAGVE